MIDPSWIAVGASCVAALLAAVAAFRPRSAGELVLLKDSVDDLARGLDTLRTAIAADLRVAREESEARGRGQRQETGAILVAGFSRVDEASRALRKDLEDGGKALREEVGARLVALGQALSQGALQSAEHQRERLDGVAAEIRGLAQRSTDAQENLRKTVEGRLDVLRQENALKLEEMRRTVDEKLQGTLEQRLDSSFKRVSDQLEQVFKSVGEMQSLAAGVGDLKRVLTGVKTRGQWAEVSLGTLLDQVMTPEQYGRNVEIRPGSGERVEFAIRLPGQGNDGVGVWLPIDAKFPSEDYERLVEASERADGAGIEAALKGLETRMRGEAKTVCSKYIVPPHSTDFAILYLPTEGLYAEVIRRPGLVDEMQRSCRIVVAGPTVLLAILNSLRMGFRTLAIQKRSSEVWQTLAAVKSEFGKYGDVLDKVKKKLDEASNTIEGVAVRKRAIDRRLAGVETLPEIEASRLLDLEPEPAPRSETPLLEAAE